MPRRDSLPAGVVLAHREQLSIFPRDLARGLPPLLQTALAHIWAWFHTNHPDCPMGHRRLAEAMGVTRVTAIRAVSRLEALGRVYVTRARRPDGGSAPNTFRPVLTTGTEDHPNDWPLTMADETDEDRKLLNGNGGRGGGYTDYTRGYTDYTRGGAPLPPVPPNPQETPPTPFPLLRKGKRGYTPPYRPQPSASLRLEGDRPGPEMVPAVPQAERRARQIIERWNASARLAGLPVVRVVSPARITAVLRLFRQGYTRREDWERMLAAVAESTELKGEGWFSFDWAVSSPEHFDKVASRWMRWKADRENGTRPNGVPPPARIAKACLERIAAGPTDEDRRLAAEAQRRIVERALTGNHY